METKVQKKEKENGLQVTSNGISQWKPPTIAELTENLELKAKDDVLLMALNLEPPAAWVVEHPTIKVKVKRKDENGAIIIVSEPLKYIPIDKQRLLGKRFFGLVEVDIHEPKQLFQSVCVTVTLRYKHPITGEPKHMDGIGAVGVQTDAVASASDLGKIKFDAVMKAAPAAASYAEKNAYDRLGRIFGGEIQKDAIRYDEHLAVYAKAFYDVPTLDELKEDYEKVKAKLTPEERTDAERIINENITASFSKLHNQLKSK